MSKNELIYSKIHKMIEAHIKGDSVIDIGGKSPIYVHQLNEELIDEHSKVLGLINASSHYIISDNVSRMLANQNQDKVNNILFHLMEDNQFHLPNQLVTIQLNDFNSLDDKGNLKDKNDKVIYDITEFVTIAEKRTSLNPYERILIGKGFDRSEANEVEEQFVAFITGLYRYHDKNKKDIMVTSPFIHFFDPDPKNGKAFMHGSSAYASFAPDWMKDKHSVLDEDLKPILQDATNEVVRAIMVLLMSLYTRGMEREKVEHRKFNKARQRSGKSTVPDYTIIKIGAVYDSHGNKVSGDIRTMPIHWRAGHFRRQHHGPGNEEIKTIWIKPCLVNFDPNNPQDIPKQKTKILVP